MNLVNYHKFLIKKYEKREQLQIDIEIEKTYTVHYYSSRGPNVSTTPITAMGCRQCLPLSVVQLKGKHCQKPHCRNGVVDTIGHGVLNAFKK